MSELLCPQCGRTLDAQTGAAFCPFCGGSLAKASSTQEDEAVRAVIAQVEALDSPVKKYELLHQAQQKYPDSLALAEELLFLGRLHERNARMLDFSVIKSYLLNIYLEPEDIAPAKIDAMRAELFNYPDLERCLALSPDHDVFINHYLTKLSCQFIDLFLRGSSRYMRRVFGIGLESRAPKLLASPAVRMLAAMRDDAALTPKQRSQLMHAFYAAFSTQLGGDTQWLVQAMAEHGVTLG